MRPACGPVVLLDERTSKDKCQAILFEVPSCWIRPLISYSEKVTAGAVMR